MQKQWDTLIEKLQVIKNDCLFESWHKDIFEHFYIDNPVRYNGIFQYYFGVKFIGKELFDRISKDTLSLSQISTSPLSGLKNKFPKEIS